MKICPSCAELYPDDAGFCPSDGSGLQRSTDPFLGRTLAGRYRLVKRIGTGGMALVYLARHVMIERMSAIKILRQDLGLHPVHRERFLREARAVNRINHANIVEITDFGEAEGLCYLVMEYVAGDSLLSHVKRGRLPWPRAVRLAAQVAAALARAHQMGVIHRDLKPENILLVPRASGGELAKLTDFGIAKLVDAPALTFSEQMFGTPGYIAPEFVEGIPPDGRADLYALGVVLYEMITSSLPYESRSQADLLLLPLTTAPIPPGTKVEGLPPDLEALLLRCLARDRNDRPRDAFELHDALADILRRFAGGGRGDAPSSLATTLSEEEPERDSVPTLLTEEPKGPGDGAEAAERMTAEIANFPTIEIASRWHAAIAEIETAIMRKRKRGGRHVGSADRAAVLAESARLLVSNVERASSRVAEHQARVDRHEARGRAFRANLGHAIDELVRDRSRERAHAGAILSRRTAVADARATQGEADAGESPASDGARESLVWEAAALDAEDERARSLDEDLGFQIATLQRQLDTENELLERELMEATGGLEGSLAAARLLTAEIVRTLDEAAKTVSEARRA
jgi:serine/threonine protein kinase